jgi:diaminopropionate ammonia-lyase
VRVVLNPLASRTDYSEREALVVSRDSAQQAQREISSWPDYRVTPLRSLPTLAARLDIRSLLYKDESDRLGQGSFKTLGGAYAATLKLRTLRSDSPVTLCCATDGNHGRSVAYAARRHGCACVVFMHRHAPVSKETAIARLGASVIRLPGTYDDSVRHAHKVAEQNGWILVADTSDDALNLTTRHVIQGYGVMILEIIDQLANDSPPSHVFVQAGVGGFAAAVAGVFADVYGNRRPRLVVVEPEAAACLQQSALRGVPSKVDGDLHTVMAMLSTGEASAVAWPVLQQRADAFISISDDAAMQALHDVGIAAGEGGLDVGISGVAGIAGLIEVLKHPEVASMLEIQAASTVLVFGTERGLDTPPQADSATR